MATTDRRLARSSLDGLTAADVPYALLHGPDPLSTRRTSDLDLVVDRAPASIIVECVDHWHQRGVQPVVFWPHDVSESIIVFLATADGRHGVQLDLLYDRHGIGEFGIRTPALLATAAVVEGLPRVSEASSLVYQWRKRKMKRQADRLVELRRRALEFDRSALLDVSRSLTGSVNDALELRGERPIAPYRRRRRPISSEAVRWFNRISQPIGCWAHVSDYALAVDLSARFGRFLVVASHTRVPPLAKQLVWWWSDVLPVKLRAGVVISGGAMPSIRPPDVVIWDDARADTDAAARQIVKVMAAKVLSKTT